MKENLCAIHMEPGCEYPAAPPFHPHRAHPEYELASTSAAPNPVYEAVRNTLLLLQLDAPHADTPAWNPLGDIIRPGDAVVVKPNFVLHFNDNGHDLAAVITHGSTIRTVLDYVLKALNGKGTVVVGDAPHGNADFERIVELTGIGEVINFYASRGHRLELCDFRQYRYAPGKNGFLRDTRTALRGDPRGYTVVDLGNLSEFRDLPGLDRLYGADYDRRAICAHHCGGRHEYLIANSVLHADVVIGLPKLKVHSKAGLSVNLKNLVGINGDKNWLPHYRIGGPGQSGDEYPAGRSRLERTLRNLNRQCQEHLLSVDRVSRKLAYRALTLAPRRILKALGHRNGNAVHCGGWPGNDTVWRMVLDLNRILLYADKQGIIHTTPQRRFLSIVDGIIAGEGDGPLGPTPRHAGIVLGGFNPLLGDLMAARLMGLDPERVPLLHNAYRSRTHPLSTYSANEVEIRPNHPQYARASLLFALPAAWQSVCVPAHETDHA